MPNWCTNYVTFQGNEATIKQIHDCFSEMREREKLGEGVAPAFFDKMECLDGYFFEIWINDHIEGETELSVGYETRWSPNTPDTEAMGKHFGVDFTHEYSESGCNIYGQAQYDFKENILTCNDLEDADFDRFSYDDEASVYSFEGELYESDTEILENIFNEKFNL